MFWTVTGGDCLWIVVDGGGYILLVVGDGGYILACGGQWWMVMAGGIVQSNLYILNKIGHKTDPCNTPSKREVQELQSWS